MKNVVGALALACFSFAGFAQAQPANGNTTETCSPGCGCRDLELTPINTIAGHVPDKREWMTGYSFMNTHLQGNQSGTSKWTDEQVYRDYAMAPRKMDMQMHMAMVMYGVTTRLSVTAMFSFAACQMTMGMKEMGMVMQGTVNEMKSVSSGPGDTRIYATYRLLNTPENKLNVTLGMGLPTGSISSRGTTMKGEGQLLAYNMQQGAGTFALLPVITYTWQSELVSFGAELAGSTNMGRNTRGYSYGNNMALTMWAARKILPWIGLSARVAGKYTAAMAGYDKDIALLMYNDPMANASNYGGTTIGTYIGLSCSMPKLRALTFRAEFGIPVYQDLNGVQMTQRNELQAGIQYVF